jgi:3-methylcrotonyl-CoA carboxylase alpha subunit
MFASLLIANRGEIAVRIIRTARRMGLRTIAVYSDADRDALHVAMADEAVRIGPAPARESYLNVARIVEAARATGAQAIHPGYGFLSEQPSLPRACVEAGLIWVGPRVEAIAAMGSKAAAKQLAIEAGVPVVPGYHGEDQQPDRLFAEARRIGFPVMVKAVAGGGGKGMRPVFQEADLAGAVAEAQREAATAFGDGRLLIEKLIARPRHVEVQLLGDKHGQIVHLFERDCSVQRNNQKLLEETPAPNLSEATRAALHTSAVKLGAAVAYDSAGTIEFILDAATAQFYFLEMNTRLQVEHTVTEAVTGLDLVEWQLRVAAGEALAFGQSDIRISGHAIQARITAERADLGFRPDVGRIALWRPPEGAGVRIDSGVKSGAVVGPNYDSLLAKVIAHGADRAQALARLIAALESLTVLGPATTRPFLVDAARHPIFAEGRATTRFIADAFPEGWSRLLGRLAVLRCLAAVVWWRVDQDKRRATQASPWSDLSAFRLSTPSGRPGQCMLAVRFEGGTTVMTIEGGPDRLTVREGDVSAVIEAALEEGAIRAEIGGVIYRAPFAVDGAAIYLRLGSLEARFDVTIAVEADAAARAGIADAGTSVSAPMPGVLAEMRVQVGTIVDAGEIVAVLESMKLFLDLRSPIAGVVARVVVAKGQTIGGGDLVMTIDPAAPSGAAPPDAPPRR